MNLAVTLPRNFTGYFWANANQDLGLHQWEADTTELSGSARLSQIIKLSNTVTAEHRRVGYRSDLHLSTLV
jgi:hypothetical protein